MSDPNFDHGNFAAAMAAGAATAKPVKQTGLNDLFVLPKGYELASAPDPEFVHAKVFTDDIASFIDYIKHFGDTDQSVIFENLPEKAVCRLDYHRASEDHAAKPAPDEHVIIMQRVESRQLREWKQFVGMAQNHRGFVEFLDMHVEQFDGGLELIDKLSAVQAESSVRFSSVQPIRGGKVMATFAETSEAKAGQSGNLEIPNELLVKIPLFEHGGLYGLKVRLRPRVSQGVLTFAMAWLNLEESLENDAESTKAAIIGGLKDFAVFRGTV